MTVIAMWAHSRSMSTAFLRMMIERGDTTVVHEPWLGLAEQGEVTVALSGGREQTVHSDSELIDLLSEEGRKRPVFVKEVLDHRYPYLYEHPDRIASFVHTFIVRHPAQTIASHYAMKPTVTRPEIGYERLFELFELLWAATGSRPLVLESERLLKDPKTTIEKFCEYTGLPYLPEALTWEAQDRPEWQRYRGWHLDVIDSNGFQAKPKNYPDTIENNFILQSFYEYHLPFYERIMAHAD